MAEVTRLLVEIDPSGAVLGGAIVDRQTAKVSRGATQATSSVVGLNTALKATGSIAKGVALSLGPLVAAFTGFAFAREVVSTIADFEEQLARLSGITNATTEDLQKLEDIARELGGSTRFSATEAAEGLEKLALAGFNVDQAIAALPATLNLATVGAISLEEAADSASNILGQFGLTAADTVRVVDNLTVVSQNSNTTVQQLAQALSFVGTDAAKAGLTIEETAAAIGVLGDRGIQATRAGTNLRQFMFQLIDPTSEAGRQIGQLGLNVDELSPSLNNIIEVLKRLQNANLTSSEAVKIFSARTTGAALTLADSTEKIQELIKAQREGAGSAQEFADKLNNTLNGALKSLISTIQELSLQAGDEGLLKILTSLVRTVTRLARAFGGLTSDIEDVNFAVEALQAVFQETITGIADIIFGILDAVKTAGNVLIAFIKTIGETIGIFIADTFDSIRLLAESSKSALTGNFTQASNEIKASLDKITNAVDETFLSIGDRFGENIEKDFIGVGFNAATNFLGSFSDSLKSSEGIFGDFFEKIVTNGTQRAFRRIQRDLAKIQKEFERQVAGREAGAIISRSDGGTGTTVRERQTISREQFIRESRTLQTLNNEIDLIGKSNEARERAIQLANLQTEAEKAFGERLAANDPIIVEFTRKLESIQRAERFQELADNIGDAFGNVFEEITFGAKSVEDAFRDLARNIVQILINELVTKQISKFVSNTFSSVFGGFGGTGFNLLGGLFSAKGNAFSNGELVPFQQGGVINSPIAFPLRNNRIGIAGEAGAEGILPLARDERGRLGVSAVGESRGQLVQNINFNISTPNADSFRSSRGQIVRDALVSARRLRN